MGIIAKQSINNVFILYFGAAAGAVNSILLYPRILPEEQYGLIGLITTIAFLLGKISGFGTSSSVIKFLPYYRDESRSNNGLLFYLLKTTVIGIFITTLVLIAIKPILIEFYSESAGLFKNFYWSIAPLFVFNVLAEIFESYVKAILKTSFQLFIKEVLFRVNQTILIGLFFLNIVDFNLFLALYLSLFLINTIILIIYLQKLGELDLKSAMNEKGILLKKEVIKFSSFSFISGMATNISSRLDILMIGAIVIGDSSNAGLKSVAIYVVASNIAAMIEMPFRAILQISQPLISTAWKEKRLDNISDIYTKSTNNMLILGVYGFLGLWCCIDNIVSFLPPEYANVKWVFMWIGIGKVINITLGLNGIILSNSKTYKVATLFSVITIVLVYTTNLALIPLFKVEGAAMATALIYLISNVMYWGYLLLKYKLQPLKIKNTIPLLLAAGILLLIQNLVDIEGIIGILIKAGIITILYWPIIILLKLSEDISKMWKKYTDKLK